MVLIENHGLVLALHIVYCFYVFFFLVVAFLFHNCVLCFCFLLFVLYIDNYVLFQLFGYYLVAQLSFFYLTFLLHSFCWALTLHSIAHLYSLISYCFVILLLFNLSFFSARHHACTLALSLLLGSPFISLILLLCYLYFALSCFCTSAKCEFFLPLSSNLVKIYFFNSLLFDYVVLFHNWSKLAFVRSLYNYQLCCLFLVFVPVFLFTPNKQ
jgi:hypothetical protein